MNERLRETRERIVYNYGVRVEYSKLLDEAELYLENNLKVVDDFSERQVGVCDYFRNRYPDKNMTDEEIIKYIDMLEDKYEKEKYAKGGN